jgi:hypothetical protein
MCAFFGKANTIMPMQIPLWTWRQIRPLFGGSKYLVHCLNLCFYLMDLTFMFSTFDIESLGIQSSRSWFHGLGSWFWFSWSWFHGFDFHDFDFMVSVDGFQFLMLTIHNLIFTISIWWSWLMILMLMISISLSWLIFTCFIFNVKNL